MSKTKKITISIIAFVLLAGGGTTTALLVMRHNTTLYNNYVNTSLENVDNWNTQFNSATSHERKVALYHGMNESHAEYISRETSNNDEIVSLLEATIFNMKEHFFDYYSTRIAEVEGVELPEHITEIISVLDDNINRLSSIKTEISNDGVFANDNSKLNQLNDKADSSLNLFAETNAWLISMVELSENFSVSDRDEKFIVFNELLNLQEEFENSGFTSDLIDSELNSKITGKRVWFFDWYTENLALLHFSTDKNHTIEEIINALIQLNDVEQLFAKESGILFTPAGVSAFSRNIGESISNNLKVLDNAGIKMIDDKDFREDAAEKAIEHLREAFAEWKEDIKDNEHLQTFEIILQETIEIGETEHIEALRREAARRTRVGFT